MAEVVLFHHVQGLTDGVQAFADQLRAGGHRSRPHTPELSSTARAQGPSTRPSLTNRASARRCSPNGPTEPWPT